MTSNTTLYNSNRPPEIVEKPGVIATTTTTTTTPSASITSSLYSNDHVLFDGKIEIITAGLQSHYVKQLKAMHPENAMIIVDYIQALKTEINLSDGYRSLNIFLLCRISKFCNNNKLFKQLSRQDLLSYLDSLRKPEQSDPSHKWIGTYNIYRNLFIRFFRWLHYPDIEQKKRPKPNIVSNIPQLKRKERSAYKPTDLWTEEDDRLFLKYCPSKRVKCYHTMSRDTSCRPHEILKLKIKDVIFRITTDNRQYAEILVNGKTGSRQIPIFNSIPYVKDYLNHEHPQTANPNAILICGMRKKFGRPISTQSLFHIYKDYKDEFFPKLLDSPNVPPEDKQKIRELLKKPWNPYIRRHSALTEKSIILKEHSLRQHAGWSSSSQMPQKYIHYFGNESSESLLQAYGILPKNQEIADALKPKQCPNCDEPNKPDAKFCIKCRMVLTYDAYNETIGEKKRKDEDLEKMREEHNQIKSQLNQFSNMQSKMYEMFMMLSKLDTKEQKEEHARKLYDLGIIKAPMDSEVAE